MGTTVYKLPGINGLRTISILFVILSHLQVQYPLFRNFFSHPWMEPIGSIITDGHLGVNVFFVISGFLITFLLLKEEQETKTISVKDFYVRRTLRIFPAYFFLLLIYFLFQLVGLLQLDMLSWITALTYTKYFYLTDWYTLHIWSLSVEEHFYLLWPLFFLAGKKARVWATILIIILVPLFRIFYYVYPIDWMNKLSIFQRFDAIATGCLFALYKDRILGVISKRWKWVVIVSVGILFAARYIPILSLKHRLHLGFIYIPLGTTCGTIANLCIALIMTYTVFGPKSYWHQVLQWKWINYIGILSYSIYLWQQFFLYQSTHWYNQFPANLFCIAAAALFSYYIIEKPFLLLKKKYSDNISDTRSGTAMRND